MLFFAGDVWQDRDLVCDLTRRRLPVCRAAMKRQVRCIVRRDALFEQHSPGSHPRCRPDDTTRKQGNTKATPLARLPDRHLCDLSCLTRSPLALSSSTYVKTIDWDASIVFGDVYPFSRLIDCPAVPGHFQIRQHFPNFWIN